MTDGDAGISALSSLHPATDASRPVKRSFSIRGHRTSISLEAAFWDALVAIARERKLSMAQLVAEVDAARGEAGLSGAVRVYILNHYRTTSAAKSDHAQARSV